MYSLEFYTSCQHVMAWNLNIILSPNTLQAARAPHPPPVCPVPKEVTQKEATSKYKPPGEVTIRGIHYSSSKEDSLS